MIRLPPTSLPNHPHYITTHPHLQGTHRLLLSPGRGADDAITSTPSPSSSNTRTGGDANAGAGLVDVRREMDLSFWPRTYIDRYS